MLPYVGSRGKIRPMSSTVPRAKSWDNPLALALLTAVIYLPTLRSQFLEIDDPVYVYQNVYINTGLTFKNIAWYFTHSLGGNWHPLTAMSHMLDCNLFGLNPALHHAENVLLHCANVVLLFFFDSAIW